MTRRATRLAVVATLAAALAGCAASRGATLPALAPADHGLGPSPYTIGPLTVVIEAPWVVDQACRAAVAASGGPASRGLTYHGCYNPTTRTIISVADPHILLHELKHHFEGAFHPPVRTP